MYDNDKLQAIIDECNEHNAEVSDDPAREPERVRSDAEFIYICRHEGIRVETLAMMLTDMKFGVKNAKAVTKTIEEGLQHVGRYDCGSANYEPAMVLDSTGDYVLYDDIRKLIASAKRL